MYRLHYGQALLLYELPQYRDLLRVLAVVISLGLCVGTQTVLRANYAVQITGRVKGDQPLLDDRYQVPISKNPRSQPIDDHMSQDQEKAEYDCRRMSEGKLCSFGDMQPAI